MDERCIPTLRVLVVVAVLALCAGSIVSTARGSSVSAPFVVSCSDIAGVTQNPRQDGWRVVLGLISVPPEDVSDRTVRVGGVWPYWEKAGMFVRTGKFTVAVSVPKAWRSRAGITWGNSQRIVSALQFRGCGTGASTPYWNAYAGGFYLRSPSACVPLVFNDGRRTKIVRFGIGRPCR